ncbi:MAG: hypothetical protein WDN31_02480 [Hyphomicrobium sp.]
MSFRERLADTAQSITPYVQATGWIALIAASLYQIFSSNLPPAWFKSIVTLALICVGSFTVMLFLLFRSQYRQKDVEKAVSERIRNSEKNGYILAKISEILVADSELCTFIHRHSDATGAEVEAKFESYINVLLTNIREIFTFYTGSTCAACIKTLNLTNDVKHLLDYDGSSSIPEDLPFVYTFARDSASRKLRAHVDKRQELSIYRYDQNTGLTLAKSDSSSGFWHHNDLKSLGTLYQNKNSDWDKYYNAALIVVLRNPVGEQVEEALGFLCVDNKIGNFDADTCRSIMEILANIVYYTLRLSVSRMKIIGGASGNG